MRDIKPGAVPDSSHSHTLPRETRLDFKSSDFSAARPLPSRPKLPLFVTFRKRECQLSLWWLEVSRDRNMDTGEIAKCYRSGLSPSPSPQPPASSHHCLHFSICSLDSIPSFIWHSTCRFPREARPHRPILTAPIGPTLPVPSLALFSFLAPLSPRRHAFCVCPVALSAPVSSVSAGTRTLHGRFLSTWHGERPRESPREFINQELTPTNLRSTCVWTIYAEPGPGRRPGDPQSSARPRKAESPELLSGSSQAPGLRTCCVSASNAPKLPSRLPCLLHWSLSLLAFRPSLPQPPLA